MLSSLRTGGWRTTFPGRSGTTAIRWMPWGLSGPEVFDKERLKGLIEKSVIYGADAVEIVWKVGNPFWDEKTG